MEALSKGKLFSKVVEAYSRPTRIVRGKDVDSDIEVLLFIYLFIFLFSFKYKILVFGNQNYAIALFCPCPECFTNFPCIHYSYEWNLKSVVEMKIGD